MAPVSLDTILARQKKYFRLEYIELVLTSDGSTRAIEVCP